MKTPDMLVPGMRASRASILFAEDDLATRALLRATLDRAPATPPADALAAIAASTPDLVLLDIGMPSVDGLQVTRTLRASTAPALLPIILVTARGRLEDIGGRAGRRCQRLHHQALRARSSSRGSARTCDCRRR